MNQESSGAKMGKFINCTNSTRIYSFDTFLVINLLFRINFWKCKTLLCPHFLLLYL